MSLPGTKGSNIKLESVIRRAAIGSFPSCPYEEYLFRNIQLFAISFIFTVEMMPEQKNRVAKSFETERPGLFAFIRSKLRSLEESEDLLQEVFFQALCNLNVLEAVDNLTGWLYAIARNKIIDCYRKKRLPTVSIDEPIANGLCFKDLLAEEIPAVLDDETRELVFQAIVTAIGELPEKQRYVFI